MLGMKAAFYLTDVEVGEGPTWVIPGSHRLNATDFQRLLPEDGLGQPSVQYKCQLFF